MSALTKGIFEISNVEKEDSKRELRKNIVIGAILRRLHKDQGTTPYLLQVVEPYLKKADRQLFGLPF